MAAEGIGSPRRYYLLKAQAATLVGDEELALAWRGKHDAAAGTPIDASFPGYASLTAARYTTLEDLTGATQDELVREAGLTNSAAREALKALDVLLAQS